MLRFAFFVSAALAFTGPAAQALTFPEDRAAFNAASTQSFFDDYENITVAPGGIIVIESPVIREPVTYTTSPLNIAAIGMNTLAPGSVRLAPLANIDVFDISFASGVTAIGFDLQSLTDPLTHKISIFNTSDILIGDFTKTVGTTAMFVSILSDVEIGRIVIDDQDTSEFGFGSVIDNLSLGTKITPTPPVPLPASGLLLLAALFGGGLAVRYMRPAI